MGEQSAFYHSNIFEIIGHIMLGKGSLNEGEIACGAFQPENDLRSVPENEKQLFFKSFADFN